MKKKSKMSNIKKLNNDAKLKKCNVYKKEEMIDRLKKYLKKFEKINSNNGYCLSILKNDTNIQLFNSSNMEHVKNEFEKELKNECKKNNLFLINV